MTRRRSQANHPASLSPRAKARWQSIMQQWDIDDERGLALLEVALRAEDEMDAAEKLIAREGMILQDRFGRSYPHPAVRIRHAARAAMLQAFRTLGLAPETDKRLRLGRPPTGS